MGMNMYIYIYTNRQLFDMYIERLYTSHVSILWVVRGFKSTHSFTNNSQIYLYWQYLTWYRCPCVSLPCLRAWIVACIHTSLRNLLHLLAKFQKICEQDTQIYFWTSRIAKKHLFHNFAPYENPPKPCGFFFKYLGCPNCFCRLPAFSGILKGRSKSWSSFDRIELGFRGYPGVGGFCWPFLVKVYLNLALSYPKRWLKICIFTSEKKTKNKK